MDSHLHSSVYAAKIRRNLRLCNSCPLRRAKLTFTISKVLLYDVQSSASAILIVILSFCHFVKMRKRKCLSDSYSIIYKIYYSIELNNDIQNLILTR